MKLYGELAAWWPLFSPPADYVEEAAFYARALEAACAGRMRNVLELGSGGGNNASHLKAQYQLVLVEPSPEMLGVSRALNPECEHVAGDMRTVGLEREFDAVFVHDAVCYMTTEDDVRAAIATAFAHCRPGGGALFAPDYLRETFSAGTDHDGHEAGGRSVQYLEWIWDPDPADTTYLVDYVIALRSEDGQIQVEQDRHVEGLFGRDDWLRWLSDAGFDARSIPFDHSELAPGSYEVFVARKPSR